MTAVVGGTLTAVAWALATLSSTRAARDIGPWSTSAWVLMIGMAATLPLLLLDGVPGDVDPGAVPWLAAAGAGYVAGMVLNYSALASGKVPVAAPIISTEGAIAAAIAVLTGEAVPAPLVVLLALVAAGVFLTALEPPGEPREPASAAPPGPGPVGGSLGPTRRSSVPFVAFAVGAALAFGTSLFAAGNVSDAVPLSWVVAAGRIAGVLLVAAPLIVGGRLRLTRAAIPFVVFSGLAEVAGYYTFAWGARDSVAVAAVLSSLFAVLAAVLAHALGERISPRQWVGVGCVAASVTAITLLRL